MFLGYVGLYRRKKYVGGRLRGPRDRGRAQEGWARPHPPGPLVRRLMPFFGLKKAIFRKKIWAKVSIQSELRISGYKRNGPGQNPRTQKQRETERQIQSRTGSRPSHAMEDQMGNPSPI